MNAKALQNDHLKHNQNSVFASCGIEVYGGNVKLITETVSKSEVLWGFSITLSLLSLALSIQWPLELQ